MPTNFYENQAIFGDRVTKKPNKAIFDPDAKMNGASWHLATLTLTPDDLLCMNIHDKGPIYDNMPKNIIGQNLILVGNPWCFNIIHVPNMGNITYQQST